MLSGRDIDEETFPILVSTLYFNWLVKFFIYFYKDPVPVIFFPFLYIFKNYKFQSK